jgi:glycogen debranching enzyme
MMKSNLTPMIETAQAVLRENDMGDFTKPGPKQYPHQWNWDSALIALGLSYFDLPRALLEIRSLLSGQWQDGMLPHVIYHENDSDYFPDPGFWQIEKSPQAAKIPTSGITQPPLLATIVRLIHEQQPITAFINEIYPHLLAWHRWLHTHRDVDGSGLVCIIHPWESGTDDSPRWLKILETIHPNSAMDFTRGDTRYVSARERPYPHDYERFIYLIDLFRKHSYNQAEILSNSPFVVQDVLFNAVLYRANIDLQALGNIIGENTDEIDQWVELMKSSFNQRFWQEDDGLYYDFDIVTQKIIQVNTGIIFLPLFAGLASQKQADRLVREYFNHPGHYAIDEKVKYRLTSASKSIDVWDPRRYWRGPVWILLNWLVYHGLENYGYELEAVKLREDSLALMSKSGFREYYDPRNGTGCGSEKFSWSAALALDWINSVI